MTDIVVHTFQSQQVRTLIGPDGEPLFNLGDVAAALGIKDVSRLASRLEDDLRQTHPIQDRFGRTQNATFVTEAGLYEVVLRSDKPDAKTFRRWVTSEVLPSIRRTGAYMTPEVTEQVLTDPDFIIQLATQMKEERARREAAEAQIEADKPHTALGRSISGGTGTLKVGEVAKLIAQNDPTIPIGQNRLFQWLRDHEWIGKRDHRPTQRVIEQGLMTMRVHPIHLNSRRMLERVTPLLTGAGQEKLITGFLDGTYKLPDNRPTMKKGN